MSVAAKTMLVYGSTGRTGLLVVNKALKEGWRVGAFARNPAKLPQVLRDDSRVTIIQGDLSDAAAVSAAVKSLKPHAIVDASSSIPLGHAKGVAPNSADRAGLTKATYETLKSESRLEECIFLIVGGQLFAEPGGTINSWSVAALAWFLKNVAMPAAARDVDALLGWMFNESDPAFRFVYARMGQMDEEPSRGVLVPETTLNNIQRGPASYCDVADAFVALASDPNRTWERKALFFNYAPRQ